jgi:exopolysaccharide biosynthesis polyprenyl glycosylphosphotransferase
VTTTDDAPTSASGAWSPRITGTLPSGATGLVPPTDAPLAGEAGQQDRHRTNRRVKIVLGVTVALDAGMLMLALFAAYKVRGAVTGLLPLRDIQEDVFLRSSVLMLLVWVLMIGIYGGYSTRNFGSGPEEFRVIGLSSVLTAGMVGLTCYLFQLDLSRAFVLLAFTIGTPLVLTERYAVRQWAHSLRSRGRLVHRVLAVGGPSGISEVVDALCRDSYIGYQVVGAVLPSGVAVEPARFPVPVVGRVQDTRRLCDELGMDTVLVARGGFDSALELRRIAWDLEGSSIDLVVVPSLTDVAGPRIHMRPVAGLPLLHVEQPHAGSAGGLPKRLFDIAAASVALLVLMPLLIAVALMIKLQDRGPVFFHQARIGRTGEPFAMIKFRSMVMDAEERLAELTALNESDGLLFKIREDPRITRVGRFLRRYSIDELPQLINVLRGEMSVVGPRPPLPAEVDNYAIDVHRRLLVRPGLTGLWQVSGRSGLSWDESVRLDLYYVDNWSMMSDLVIVAKTVKAVLSKTGAY